MVHAHIGLIGLDWLIVWIRHYSNVCGGLRKTFFYKSDGFGRSMSSKVIAFGTNRKRVCDFLLVRRSNLGPILHRVRDIAGFCAHDPPLFHPNC